MGPPPEPNYGQIMEGFLLRANTYHARQLVLVNRMSVAFHEALDVLIRNRPMLTHPTYNEAVQEILGVLRRMNQNLLELSETGHDLAENAERARAQLEQ